MEPKFKTGDVVKLKSSNVHMGVSKVHTRPNMADYDNPLFTGKYTCNWIDTDKKPQSGTYEEDELELVKVE